jgi:hypothetical protein
MAVETAALTDLEPRPFWAHFEVKHNDGGWHPMSPYGPGIGATAVVLVFFAIDTVRNAPETFGAIVGIAVLAVILDLVWKWWRDRHGTFTPDASAVVG